MSQHTIVHNESSKRLAQDWSGEVKISEPYSAYRNEFMKILTESQMTWDGHLARISLAKHCIELFGNRTQPVHSAPYRAKPKTQQFDKIYIEKMLEDNLIEPAQTE